MQRYKKLLLLVYFIQSLVETVWVKGKGESACMTYARFHHNVVGSSNLKDIRDYCAAFGIAYLTTWDFLYYALKADLMTKDEIWAFVQKVRAVGSILPDKDIETYSCGVF